MKRLLNIFDKNYIFPARILEFEVNQLYYPFTQGDIFSPNTIYIGEVKCMNKILPVFFIALGVVIGGTVFGSIGGLLTGQSPLKIMSSLADDLKLYAVVSAIGGTFNNLRLLEGSVFQGEINVLLQQLILLISAFLGAMLGNWLIITFVGGR